MTTIFLFIEINILFSSIDNGNNNGSDNINNGAGDNGDGTADASANLTSTATGSAANSSSSTRYAVTTHFEIKFNRQLARGFLKPLSTPRWMEV